MKLLQKEERENAAHLAAKKAKVALEKEGRIDEKLHTVQRR